MDLSINIWALLAMWVLIGIGCAIQGSVGYGMNIVAGPFLMMIEPRLIPGPLLVAAFFVTILILWREKQKLDLRGLSWIIAGRIVGTVIAAIILTTISTRTLGITFGSLVILAVVMSASGLHFYPTRPMRVGAGLISGIMGTLGSIGGPPVALIYQDSSPQRLRSTLSGYFIFGTIISMAALIPAGKFGWEELKLSLLLLPGIVVGFFVSGKLIPLIKGNRQRIIIWSVSIFAGATLLIQQLLA